MLDFNTHAIHIALMAKKQNSSRGPGQRQLRVGESIRRILSEIFARGELHDPELAHVSITVGEVRMSPDLSVATVFVLPLGGENAKEVSIALARNKGEIRHLVTKELDIRFSPDLRFLPDLTFDQMAETERLLNLDAVKRDLAKPDEEE